MVGELIMAVALKAIKHHSVWEIVGSLPGLLKEVEIVVSLEIYDFPIWNGPKCPKIKKKFKMSKLYKLDRNWIWNVSYNSLATLKSFKNNCFPGINYVLGWLISSLFVFSLQHWRRIYLTIACILILITFVIQTHQRFLSARWAMRRLLLFCTLVAYGVFPVLHWVYLNGGMQTQIVQVRLLIRLGGGRWGSGGGGECQRIPALWMC